VKFHLLPLLILLTSTGCAHVAGAGPIWSESFPRVDVPAVEAVPPDAPAPVALDAGEPAPWVGVLVITEEAISLAERARQRDLLLEALHEAYTGRQYDRDEAQAIVDARELQLREARRNQGRLFGLGVGLGVGGTIAAVLAVALAP
jgi:hypothetical protein